MKLQASQFADVFAHMRDHAKPLSQQDAADLAAVRAPMPPSKAHLKRLARHAKGVVHADPAQNREISHHRVESDKRMDFHKRLIAELGGSRTIAPTEDGTLYNARERGILNTIAHPRNSDMVVDKPTPMDVLFAERKTLALKHRKAMASMVYSDYQYSLLDNIEFGL